MILAFTLAGQIGKKGAGIAAFPFLSIAGPDALAVADGKLPPKLGLAALGLKALPAMARMKLDGYSTEMMLAALTRLEYKAGRYLATPLWLYMYGGLEELYGSARRWEPSLPREFKEYFDEAVEKGWQVVPSTRPRIVFEVGGNLLRRVRGYDRMIDGLLPKLDLLVTVDWRMSNTARFSDYVLPCGGLVREGRHHLGLAHHALLPRHHSRRGAPGRVQARLGVPLPLPQGAPAAGRRARAFLSSWIEPGRRGAWIRCTTSSPSAAATRRTIPRSSSTRCSRSPPTWAT